MIVPTATPRRLPALALRVGGLVLIAAAWFAVRTLVRLHAPGAALSASPVALLLAIVAFPAASGGATLLILGGHIFDAVTVRARWL